MATSKCYRLTINNCVRVRVCVCAIFIVLLAWESCESMMRFDESRQRIMGNGVRGEWQSYRTECPLVELVVIVTASLWKSIYWCVGFSGTVRLVSEGCSCDGCSRGTRAQGTISGRWTMWKSFCEYSSLQTSNQPYDNNFSFTQTSVKSSRKVTPVRKVLIMYAHY